MAICSRSCWILRWSRPTSLVARSASYFDSASAFAVVAVLGAIGFVSDRLIVALRGRVVFWERGASL